MIRLALAAVAAMILAAVAFTIYYSPNAIRTRARKNGYRI